MPHFSFTHDMHAFDGVDFVVDYRISGTFQDAENYTFDTVEVMGRGAGLTWDGWRRIDRLHPLHAAVDAYLDTPDADLQAALAIREAMDAPGRRRKTVPIVAWIGDGGELHPIHQQAAE